METEQNPTIPHPSHTRAVIIGALVITLIAIGCGLYLWGYMLTRQAQEAAFVPPLNTEPETPRAIADAQIFETVSSSNELDAIEADLGSTLLDSLDSELSLIERELE